MYSKAISSFVPVAPTVIQTFSGDCFDILNPAGCLVSIEDIAHALSMTCRFNGHVREFYSVAQHCVLVSHQVSAQNALAGLLHDASEAVLGDVVTPLKRLLPDYSKIEHAVEEALLAQFGVATPQHPEIKQADLTLLVTEIRDVMAPARNPAMWAYLEGFTPLAERIDPLPPKEAEALFLARYAELTLLPA